MLFGRRYNVVWTSTTGLDWRNEGKLKELTFLELNSNLHFQGSGAHKKKCQMSKGPWSNGHLSGI